jgi:hypothetical protein
MRINVVLPSRGLVFTEVLEELEKMRSAYPIKVFFSHNLPIPEAQNELVNKALKDSPAYIFFIEEDTVPIKNALPKLLEAIKPKEVGAACIDYAMHNNYSTIQYRRSTKEILFCGLGMTLVKREVFDKIPLPFFRADKAYSINEERWLEGQDPHKVYGMHDIWFTSNIRRAGYKIVQVEGECRHLKIVSLGRTEVNNGLHLIDIKGKILNHYEIEGKNL